MEDKIKEYFNTTALDFENAAHNLSHQLDRKAAYGAIAREGLMSGYR